MNIKAMLARNQSERRAVQRAMADPFWRPIFARWLTWLGCSWAVASVFVLAPFFYCAVRGICVIIIKLAAK